MPDPATALTTTVAIGAAYKTLSPAVQTFLDGVARAPGDAIGERLAARVKAQEATVQGALEINPELTGDQVSTRSLVPIFEGAGLEDPGDVAALARWSALLASSVENPDMTPTYAGILRDLAPLDARVLDVTYQAVCVLAESTWPDYGANISDVSDALAVPLGTVQLSCENLGRFRLARSPGHNVRGEEWLVAISLTRLGYGFVTACRSPASRLVPPATTPRDLIDRIERGEDVPELRPSLVRSPAATHDGGSLTLGPDGKPRPPKAEK